MKNPFAKLFTPNYEDNILKALEENLYDARRGFMVAAEAKQRADATLQYSTTRVEYLKEALAKHKEANEIKTSDNSPKLDVGDVPKSGNIKLQ